MSNFEKLQGRLAAGETILMDGGMGSELERRGLASPTTWSGGPMLTHPELVRDIHQEYIEAGAEIIITNTFGAGRDMLEEGGLEHKVAEANKLGIEATVQARKNAGTEDSVVIAASVSTMTPKTHAEAPAPYEKALETYREQLGELAKGGPDGSKAPLTGEVAEILNNVRKYEEAGLEHLVLSIPSSDGDGTIEAVSRFADEVVQKL